MAFSLFPKTVQFFDLLSRQNDVLQEAVVLLNQILDDFGNVKDACKRVNIIEAEADILIREITHELSQTFITPIDREDIHRISLAQEESINHIKGIATRARLYGFTKIRFPARKIAQNMLGMVEEATKMLACLHARQGVEGHVKQVKSLKAECEMLLGTGLAELQDQDITDFNGIIDIIKWTQVYDRIELAVERVEDLADILEEVVLKNA